MEKKKQGFASMSKERQIELARKGGINAHKKGVAHEFNSETGRRAGKKTWKNRNKKIM